MENAQDVQASVLSSLLGIYGAGLFQESCRPRRTGDRPVMILSWFLFKGQGQLASAENMEEATPLCWWLSPPAYKNMTGGWGAPLPSLCPGG